MPAARQSTAAICLFILLILGIGLCGCGQKGDLYLPQDNPPTRDES